MIASSARKDISNHSAMYTCMLACFLASLMAIGFTVPRLRHSTDKAAPNLHDWQLQSIGTVSHDEEIQTSAPARRLKKSQRRGATLEAGAVVPAGAIVRASKVVGHEVESPRFGRPGLPTLNAVEDLHAVADGASDDTEALRKGLDMLEAAGGGVIIIPSNKVVRTGPLRLRSHMTLFVQRGATLLASQDVTAYPVVKPLPSYGTGREGSKRGRRGAFLWGENAQDVIITGNGGTIDGAGSSWWDLKFGSGSNHFDGITLPGLIEFRGTHGLEVSHLQLVNSPFWTVHPFACKGVVVEDVVIRNPVKIGNTDGVNPDSSEDVLIKDVEYTGGDDAIAIKSGWDCFGDERGFNRPSRNIKIQNVTVHFTRSAAIAIGSEMSGGVEDVRIDGLRVEHAGNGGVIGIKTTAARGGFVRRVRISQVLVGDVEGVSGVFTIAGKFGSWVPERNPACKGPPRALTEIRDISLENAAQIQGTRATGIGFIFKGLEEGQTIRNLSLRHVSLAVDAQNPATCERAETTVANVTFVIDGASHPWHGCQH